MRSNTKNFILGTCMGIALLATAEEIFSKKKCECGKNTELKRKENNILSDFEKDVQLQTKPNNSKKFSSTSLDTNKFYCK